MFEKLEQISGRYKELTELCASPDVIADMRLSKGYVKERSAIEETAETYDRWKRADSNLAEAEALAADADGELADMAKEEAGRLAAEKAALEERLKILLLPKDPNDDNNVIIEIRAGAGGDEAALFAPDVRRMYFRYAERQRWKTEEINVSESGLGGIKEATFSVMGSGAYSKLKFESGVHRVQRVPATESQGRIHTSTITVAVLPEVDDIEVNIDEKDLKIDTYRSGGAGGQHVNKTESAIRITHIPTGIVVACQDERSQIKNRDKAMKALRSKLYDFYREKADKEYSQTRKTQIGTGDWSERIRTYNFPQGRVTDHRIGLTLHSLDAFMDGDLDEMIEALRLADRTARLQGKQGE